MVAVDVLLTALSVVRTSQSCETGGDSTPTPVKKKKKKSQCQSQNNISEPELPSGYVDFISSVSTRRLVLSPVTLINVGVGVVAYLTSAQYVW